MIYTSVLENYELDNQINCLMNEIIEESNIVLEDTNEEEKKTKLGEKIKQLFISAWQKILKLIKNIIRAIREFLRKAKQMLFPLVSIKIKMTKETIPVKYAVIKDNKGNEISEKQFKNYIVTEFNSIADCIDNLLDFHSLINDTVNHYFSSSSHEIINKEKTEEAVDKICNYINKDITKYDVNTEVYSAFDMKEFEEYNNKNRIYFDIIQENYSKIVVQKLEKLEKSMEDSNSIMKKIDNISFSNTEEKENFIITMKNEINVIKRVLGYINNDCDYFLYNMMDKFTSIIKSNFNTLEEMKKEK